MRFKNYLDKILSQKSKVKALRHLIIYKNGISIRELSRAIKLTPPNTSVILHELEIENLLISGEFGKAKVFSVNKDHYLYSLMQKLFREEYNVKNVLAKKLKNLIKFPFESLILFGSVARGSDHPKSDIDIAVIIKDKDNSAMVEEKIMKINGEIVKYFGNSLSPVIIKRNDFKKRYFKSEPLVVSIAKEGEVLGGKLISELL